MQMSRSSLPKPAAAPAHSNSVPGLVLCRVGAAPVHQTLLKLWIVERPRPCRQERQPPTRNTHLFLGKQPLGLSVEGNQHGQFASRPPGGMVSQQWPGSGLCCWQQDGAALVVETHTVDPHTATPSIFPQSRQRQCSWLYLLLCLVPLALGTLYSEHRFVVQRLQHLLDAFCVPGTQLP